LTVESAKASTLAATKDAQKEFLITGIYKLQPPNGPTFSSSFPLRIQAPAGGLVIVVSMPIEQYVEHVVMAETGDFRNLAALEVMAVAARSYAKRFNGQHSKEGFDFCDSTHCQVFYWRSVTERIRTAAEATSGEYVSYQGKVAAAFYHQNCGGTTAAGSETWAQVSEPYLSVHPDPYCVSSGGMHWETTLTREQIDRALGMSGFEPPQNWLKLEISSRTSSQRVRTLNLSGGNPAGFPLSGSSLRSAVNRMFGWNKIRSDLYDLRNSGGKLLFSGRGAGHGVGLCQVGAEEMARQGKTYKEILSFYYPGTQVSSSEGEAWQKRSDERFDLISTDPEADSSIFPVAERLLREAENDVGWRLPFHVRLQVFRTLDSYRDTTGQPGWVAASTRGQTIRLQPIADLRRRSILEPTLRHELYHLLVETRASRGTPLWFREGLTLYLANPTVPETTPSPMTADEIEEILKHGDTRENRERAYASAHPIVAALVNQHGKPAVLGWLSDRLPADVLRSLALSPHNGPNQQPRKKPH
jgi:stage II sporulation protein D